MPLVQVRDVPEETVARLKARAKAQGITLAALVRMELERVAARPTNDEVIERIVVRDRTGGPNTKQSVALIRRLRETS